jgi:hypothetical protein
MDRAEWRKIEELAREAQAEARMENGTKHPRIVFSKDGRSRFITISRSPSDHRTSRNRLRQARQALLELERTQ